MCAELARSSHAAVIESKTGLVIDAYFSASKIRWLLENVPDERAKACDGENSVRQYRYVADLETDWRQATRPT